MAVMSKRWRLDVYAEPTERRPSAADVAEALYALQVEATDIDVQEIASSPFGSMLVAIVKHLARSSGSWHVVELDGPSFLDDAAALDDDDPPRRRPKIEDVIQGG